MRPIKALFLLNRPIKMGLVLLINLAAGYAFAGPPSFYVSGETSVCYGAEERYTVGGTVRCPSYSWRVLGGQIIASGANYIVVEWNGLGEGEVSVSTPGCGAIYSVIKTVGINGSRSPDLPAITRHCGSTVLTRGTPPTEVTWYWQTSPQGRSRANADATYTCTANTTVYLRAYAGNKGCWGPATTIPVTVSQAPDFTVTGNTAICQGTATQLSAAGTNGISYSWSPDTGLSDPNSASPWAAPTQTTTYTVTGTLNDCTTARQVTVEVAAPFNAAVNSQGAADLSTVLTASNHTQQPASYSWTWPGSAGSFGGPTLVVKPQATTTYTLTATLTGYGCVSTATITVAGQNQNYISTNAILEAGRKTAASIATLKKEQRAQSTTYFDGLGRQMQTVLTQGSPAGKDVVQPVAYDAFGRPDRKYLPYADAGATNGFYKPGAIKTPDAYQSSDQYLFYQTASAGPGRHARDEAPYAQTIFEASPLNRVLEQGAPGAAFQPGTNRTVKFAERTNAAGQVRLWECSGDSYYSPGFYEADQLYVTETRDEHDYLTLAFQDKQGNVVLKQTQDEEGLLSTYYIFDELDNLRLVVQPEGAKRIAPGPFSPDAAFIAAWCFRYSYDGRRRLAEKQVPGAGLVYLVYDQRDRLVLSQDGVQRGRQQWGYTRYDARNRPVETGLYQPGDDLGQVRMQMQVDAFIASQPGNQNNAGLPGAGAASFPDNTGQTEPLTYTFYDDYPSPQLDGKAFVAEIGLSDNANGSNTYTTLNHQVRGQVTGSQVKVLGTTTWLTTVNYYNGKYQLIQVISDNYLGGTDRISSQYDFAGRVLETLLTQTSRVGQYLVHNQFTYDHGGRLLETRQRTGTDASALLSQPQILLASLQYNELGQLVDKSLHGTGTGQTPQQPNKYLQSVDYRYHIRGWLTHINNADLSVDDQNNDDADDAFGLELTYDKPDAAAPGAAGSSAQRYYNGNISQAIWKTQSPGGPSCKRAYQYTYDRLGRLLEARYGSQNMTDREDFSLWGLRYDGNGNITQLNRKGLRMEEGRVKSYGIIDQLSYHYQETTGNQLQGVDDLETTASAHDFEDRHGRRYSSGAEYGYDANGNMIRDDNKGIRSISYNHLNLPESIDFGEGNRLEFIYTATGLKLQKKVYQAGQLGMTTDYPGSFVYETPAGEAQQLLFAHMAEGRVLYRPGAANQWAYEYHLQDHLGNLRVSVREGEQISEFLSMEPARAFPEEQAFERVSTTRHKDYPHAHSGEHAARLNASQGDLLGPGKRLQLKKGDQLKVEVYGHYRQEDKQPLLYSLGAFLAAHAGLQLAKAPKEGPAKQEKGFPLLSAGLALTPQVVQQVKGAPQAYLSFIAYDSTGAYIGSDYQLLTKAAQDNWQPLQLAYTAEQDGYVEVFTANESGQDAYFDDLLLTLQHGMIVQENHYDPWGLNLIGIEKEGRPDHKFQYNGKEKQEEFGLLWNDYGARFYDPQLGRWHSADQLADQLRGYSPYNFGLNNPLRFVDPDGNAPFDIAILGANNSSITVETNLVDVRINASSLGIDFGGNYSLSGQDVVQAALDIGGVFDPTGALDVMGAGMSWRSGDYLGAIGSGLGAVVPYAGDLAKTGKIAAGIEKIGDAIDVAKGADKASVAKKVDFIVTPDGVAVPKNQERMRKGFDNAGFPSKPATQTSEKGVIHTIPTNYGKVDVRTMEGSKHPKRAVVTHPNTNNPKTPSGKATTNKKDNHIEQH